MQKMHKSDIYLLLAGVWAALLILAAWKILIVSIQPTITDSGSPVTSSIAEVALAIPRVSISTYYGSAGFVPASMPLITCLIVFFLLKLWSTDHDLIVGKLAWLFSFAILAFGIVGFLTFLFTAGLAIVPVGVLLLIACKERMG